jgi:hypothetical protein
MTPPVIRHRPGLLLRYPQNGGPPSELSVSYIRAGILYWPRELRLAEAEAVLTLVEATLARVVEAWPVGRAAIAAVVHGRWN